MVLKFLFSSSFIGFDLSANLWLKKVIFCHNAPLKPVFASSYELKYFLLFLGGWVYESALNVRILCRQCRHRSLPPCCVCFQALWTATLTTTGGPGLRWTWVSGCCPPPTRCVMPAAMAAQPFAPGSSRAARTASPGSCSQVTGGGPPVFCGAATVLGGSGSPSILSSEKVDF